MSSNVNALSSNEIAVFFAQKSATDVIGAGDPDVPTDDTIIGSVVLDEINYSEEQTQTELNGIGNVWTQAVVEGNKTAELDLTAMSDASQNVRDALKNGDVTRIEVQKPDEDIKYEAKANSFEHTISDDDPVEFSGTFTIIKEPTYSSSS